MILLVLFIMLLVADSHVFLSGPEINLVMTMKTGGGISIMGVQDCKSINLL